MKLRSRQLKIAIIVLMAFVAIVALFAACSKEKKSSDNAPKKAVKVSEKIAVVNEDSGVEYSEGIINYSDEFIKTLSEDEFELTSSQEAESGLKDGSYSGVIMFPANLSFTILNLNYTNPQKIKLEYSISDKADKELSDETHVKIIETYQGFNDKLSYAYINALMEEIEQGQNSVSKIFGNDSSIIEAAEKFSNGDYDSEYDEPDMPENDFQYTEQDTSEYRTSGTNYLNDVDKLYQEAYTKAYEEGIKLEKPITQKETFEETAKAISSTFISMNNYKNAMKEFTKENTGEYSKYAKKVKAYESDVIGYIANVEEYRKSVSEYIKALNLSNDHPEDMNLKKDLAEAEGTMNTLKATLETAEENISPKSGQTSRIGESPKLPEDTLPKDKIFSTLVKTHNENTTDLLNAVEAFTTGLKPENMLSATKADTGDGKSYKDKMDEKRQKFEKDTTDTTDKFNTIQKNNIEKLTSSYEKNNKYMSNTVKALNKKATKDQEILGKAVENFLKNAKSISADTKKRLESFRNMLSSAKVNGRVSSDVMQFLIQPIELVEYMNN